MRFANTANMQVASRYAVIDFIPPVGPIRLTVRWPRPPQQVTLVPSNAPLATRWEAGLLYVTVPEVAIHEVVVVE